MLLFEPGSEFDPSGARRSLRHQMADLFTSSGRMAVAVALVLGVLQGLVAVLAVHARELRLIVVAAAAAFLALCLHLLYARLKDGICRNLTHRVLGQLAKLPSEFFARRRSTALVARVQLVDAVALQLVHRLVAAAVAAVTIAVVLIGTALAASWWIAALFAGQVISGLMVARIADRSVRDEHPVVAGQLVRDGLLSSALAASDTLAAEGGSRDLISALESSQRQLLSLQRVLYDRVHKSLRRVAAFDMALSLGIWLVVLYVVSHLPGSLGQVMPLVPAAALLALQQGVLTRTYVEVKNLRPKLAVLDDILRSPTTSRFVTGELGPGLPEQQIRLHNVSFGYTAAQPVVVRQANLTVCPGKMVHIVGASGSGKSTLARLLVGVLPPSSGTVETDVRQLAYVAQASAIFPGSVADNVALWDPSISAEDIEDALGAVGLREAVAKRGGPWDARVAADGTNFSGGQRQSLALARALARCPKVLVVDNATSAMDRDQERNVLNALRERGVTTVWLRADARLGELADAVYVLEGGRLTPWNTPALP
ncbi:hypothetical protein BIV23_29050 [Streptomyces monashensis]|uniref:ABC transporter n=1 Tax=Streptomyces monashensis TaxID=1678012 RepID=A0A1S2PZ11_9ACTN|nr:hypothetical protein BIV23_29050 [Streptomyces monashensis]